MSVACDETSNVSLTHPSYTAAAVGSGNNGGDGSVAVCPSKTVGV